MRSINILTEEQLNFIKEKYVYSVIEGILYRREDRLPNKPYLPCIIKPDIKGYCTVKVYYRHKTFIGIKYHRLVWIVCNQQDPKYQLLDHIDGNKSNNRIENLRLSDNSKNVFYKNKNWDGSSRFKGVDFKTREGRWRARISKDDKCIYLGMFKTEKEAAEAYNKAAVRLFGSDYYLPNKTD